MKWNFNLVETKCSEWKVRTYIIQLNFIWKRPNFHSFVLNIFRMRPHSFGWISITQHKFLMCLFCGCAKIVWKTTKELETNKTTAKKNNSNNDVVQMRVNMFAINKQICIQQFTERTSGREKKWNDCSPLYLHFDFGFHIFFSLFYF